MNPKSLKMAVILAVLLLPLSSMCLYAANTTPPASTAKLIFIHHSTGGNWLADPNTDQPYGGLGSALMTNNYFASATNYGWGPNSIGDATDIPNWPDWFTGPDSATVLAALYSENGQNFGDFGYWSRLSTNPGGENRIIMLKSCYPNSDLFGNPDDPPAAEVSDQYSVSNAKAVYNNLLTYFQTRQDKLFIVITAPPQNRNEYGPDYQTPDARAANARAFNNWLINDWLKGYAYNNVAVFDYYNVLTGADNHHRWYNGAVQHVVATNYNFAAYPDGEWNSHPNTTGQLKATTEFVSLLNYSYNRFIAGSNACLSVGGDVSIRIPSAQYGGTNYAFTLVFYSNPNDPSGLYWKMDMSTFTTGSGSGCITVGTDLGLPVCCAEYASVQYQFTLNFYNNPSDPSGLYWKMDLSTFKVK